MSNLLTSTFPKNKNFYGKPSIFEKNKTLKEKRILLPRIIVWKVHTEPFTADQNKRINEETKRKKANFFLMNMYLLMIQITKLVILIKLNIF